MSEVIVVGGGPAGSATALRLARAGHAVTLLERAQYPRPKPCAEYMSPGVLRELCPLGVAEAVEHAAKSRLYGFTLYAAAGRFTGRFGRAADGGPRYGVGLPRAVLDEILARAAQAAGVTLREGVRVTDLLREGERVTGVRALADGRVEELRAPLVVGADGVRSVVGRRLGALAPRVGMERIALVAHLSGISGLGDTGEMHIGPAGYCGVAPLGEGVANVAMVQRNAASRLRGRTELFFWEELAKLPALSGRLAEARIVRPILAIGPTSYAARFYSADGALLVGDAGGYYDPFTGQGVHRALVSARLGAAIADDALRAGDLSRQRLRAYDGVRRAAFREAHAVEWLVQQFIGRPALFARAARRLAASPGMADTLVGVTGDLLSPRRVLSPWYLARLAL